MAISLPKGQTHKLMYLSGTPNSAGAADMAGAGDQTRDFLVRRAVFLLSVDVLAAVCLCAMYNYTSAVLMFFCSAFALFRACLWPLSASSTLEPKKICFSLTCNVGWPASRILPMRFCDCCLGSQVDAASMHSFRGCITIMHASCRYTSRWQTHDLFLQVYELLESYNV